MKKSEFCKFAIDEYNIGNLQPKIILMISDIKQIFNKSFFQEISEEKLFGEWNKEKTVFNFHLTPELLAHNVSFFEDGPGYLEHYNEKLEKIVEIGIISDYEKLSNIGYKEGELKELLLTEIIYNFDYLCDENCGVYHLEYNIDKLKLLEEILYNTKKVKYGFSLGLLKAILKVIWNENIKIDMDRSGDVVDIDVLIDYLQTDNQKYIFYDFEVLIYALSTYKMEYIAKIISFLLEVADKDNKKLLLTSIKLDNNFHYFEDSYVIQIKKSYNSMSEGDRSSYLSYLEENRDFNELLILEGKNEGNIYYYEKYSSKNASNLISNNFRIKYNIKTSTLEYNGKKVGFAQGKGQKELVEKLYENINSWISEDVIGKKGQQTLKDIGIKMKKRTGGEFTSLEIKQLFQTFEDNKKRYFIMIG